MDIDFLSRGPLFVAGIWVAFACAKRIWLMQWSSHEPVVIAAYIGIALWAASYVLGIVELQPLGIVAVAALFFAGRKRWLTEAPEETRTAP